MMILNPPGGPFVVIFLTLLTSIYVGGKKLSSGAGVWVDDGNGQTVKAELPPREGKILRRQMLDVLGLPEHHRRHHIKNYGSAPIFLKSIYDALDERGHAPHLEAHYRDTVSAADLIMTFINKNSKLKKHRGAHRRFWFDVNDVSLEVSLLWAELRIYRTLVPNRPEDEELALQIYLGCEEKSKELVIAKGILPKEGWISFNITTAFLEWIIFPEKNLGLRIAVTRVDQKHELHLTDVGILSGHDNENYHPFIVGFFTEPHDKELVNHHSRVTRAASLKSEYNNPNPMHSYINKDRNSNSASPKNSCEKRNLYVSFRDLGWQDWVIAPEGYNANFCDGKCQFPMLANMNATNHAIIQTLVKMKSSLNGLETLPPDACCSPRDLTTISVLYIDYSNNVVLKKYPKMIVKTCGCI